jgi:hypothetical protein
LQDCPIPSLSHSLPSLPPIDDELPPRRTPMTPPASHPSPCTPPSLLLSPALTMRTLKETQASVVSQPLLPRHQRPLDTIDAAQSTPAAPTGVGPAATLALTLSSMRHGRRERAPCSRSCTRPFSSHRTLFCTALNVQSCSTHAQHFYPSTWPARDRN